MTYGNRQLLIDGRLVDAESGKTCPSINPATGDVIAEVAEGDAPEIDNAVAAARRAFEEHWRDMPATERGALLRKVAELISERGDDLALMETLDQGKPLEDSRTGDIVGAAAYFDFYAGAADKIHGDTVPFAGFFNYTVREPLGVVGAIVPWNYPLALAAIKCAPALACGNTVVLKPAEQTPLTALELGKICLDAGLPPGVVNVVTGFGPTAGAALARHAGVDKVTFTGSSEVGHKILEMSAGNLKRTVLELGGKTANIVFADADLDAALNSAVRTIFLNQGQICTAGSRLLIDESIKDDFVARLVAKAERLKVGDPLKPDTKMGAIVSEEQLEKIKLYIKLGKEAGATLLTGGRGPDDPDLAAGYFMLPTVFDDVDNSMRIAQEEIFGPVLSVITFTDEDDAIAKANAVKYGLASALWTKDITRAHRVADQLESGIVWINVTNVVGPQSPYCGYKASGLGHESGMDALETFTRLKSVWVNLSDEPHPWADT
ncbi:MAG: aldehyde dehydrogenase family protein [Armatimonadota bacterium]|jgi:acyl-CoA reductase-like NAD-dependent aldehyde dehydrogenase